MTMQREGEPSVEDILQSIKRVIARDNRAATEDRTRPARVDHENPPVSHDNEDVFELTDEHASEDESAEGPLLNPNARASMRESLSALAMLAEPGAAPQIVRSGETSLEGLVREMLRPMLAEWLDRNLPGMVENMVASEI